MSGDGPKRAKPRDNADSDKSEKSAIIKRSKPPPEVAMVLDEGRSSLIRQRRTTEAVKTELVRIALEMNELERTTDPETLAKAASAASAELANNGSHQVVSAGSAEEVFTEWAKGYDTHMEETGHDRALEIVLKMIVEAHFCKAPAGGHLIFGGRLLEMGCGTGAAIIKLAQLLPAGEFESMEITANDITRAMIAQAEEKRAGMDNVTYTIKDICKRVRFGHRFETVILSQTLPFIADPVWLERENQQGIENSEHVHKKLEVIRWVFDKLLEINGYFILIDEWPMKFTDSTRSPGKKETDIELKFRKIFRPIKERSTLYNRIFKRIPGARFVAEVKIRIDKEHSMYCMVYRNDPDKLDNRNRHLPTTEEKAAEEGIKLAGADAARERAVHRLMDTLRAIDRHFTEHFKPINGESEVWTELMPIDEKDVYDSREGKPIDPESSYNTIILTRKLHELGEQPRQRLMKDALRSLRDGGALVVIEEWAAPENAPHPIRKRDWRDEVLVPHRDRLVFQASFREPIVAGFDSGMYCYVYRKRF